MVLFGVVGLFEGVLFTSQIVHFISHSEAVRQAAMARGLLVYPMGGTIDGRNGDHVTLAPPFTVTESELDLIVDRLGEAMDAALAG